MGVVVGDAVGVGDKVGVSVIVGVADAVCVEDGTKVMVWLGVTVEEMWVAVELAVEVKRVGAALQPGRKISSRNERNTHLAYRRINAFILYEPIRKFGDRGCLAALCTAKHPHPIIFG